MELSTFVGRSMNGTTWPVLPINSSWSQSSLNVTNDTSNEEEWEFGMGIFTHLIPVLYFLIFITGIIGNSLVLIVLHKYSDMKTVPNIFIVNLSIADFLFMLTLPFIAYSHYLEGVWPFGDIICRIVIGFDAVNQYTGIYLITAMAIDRFVAIAYPIKTMGLRTVRNTRMACVLVWLISILLSLPLWMYTKTHEDNHNICTIKPPEFFPIYSFVIGFVIPLFIIGGCYSVVLKIILFSRRPMNSSSGSSKDDSTSTRITVLVLCIVITFFICWFPFYLLSQFIRPEEGSEGLYRHSVAFIIAITLSYANSSLNPLIYTFVGKNFREHICSLLCSGKFSHQQRRKRLNRRSVCSTGYKRSNNRSMSTFSENYTMNSSVRSHVEYPYNKIAGNSRPNYNGNIDIDEV